LNPETCHITLAHTRISNNCIHRTKIGVTYTSQFSVLRTLHWCFFFTSRLWYNTHSLWPDPINKRHVRITCDPQIHARRRQMIIHGLAGRQTYPLCSILPSIIDAPVKNLKYGLMLICIWYTWRVCSVSEWKIGHWNLVWTCGSLADKSPTWMKSRE